MKTIAKMLWRGKVTVLAVVIALTLVAGGTAVAKAKLVKATLEYVSKAGLSGSVMKLTNNQGGSALDLVVNSGKAPLTVNSGAGTATNLSADKLDGYNANELARVARANAGQKTLTASEQDLVTVSLTAPTNGFVLVQSDYNIWGAGEAWMLLRDDAGQSASNFKIVNKHSVGYDSGSMGWVFPVSAGTHTYKLTGRGVGGTPLADGPTIQALFVPFGSSGQPGVLSDSEEESPKADSETSADAE